MRVPPPFSAQLLEQRNYPLFDCLRLPALMVKPDDLEKKDIARLFAPLDGNTGFQGKVHGECTDAAKVFFHDLFLPFGLAKTCGLALAKHCLAGQAGQADSPSQAFY